MLCINCRQVAGTPRKRWNPSRCCGASDSSSPQLPFLLPDLPCTFWLSVLESFFSSFLLLVNQCSFFYCSRGGSRGAVGVNRLPKQCFYKATNEDSSGAMLPARSSITW